MAKSSLPIVPLAVVGGIGYFLYSNWELVNSWIHGLFPHPTEGDGNAGAGGGSSTHIANVVTTPATSPTTPAKPVQGYVPPSGTLFVDSSGNTMQWDGTKYVAAPGAKMPDPVAAPSGGASLDVYKQMSLWVSSNLDWFTSHGGKGTFDEWNAIRANFEGVQSFEDVAPSGMDRTATLTLAEYWSLLTAKGITGLGQILDLDAFFTETPRVRMHRGNF